MPPLPRAMPRPRLPRSLLPVRPSRPRYASTQPQPAPYKPSRPTPTYSSHTSSASSQPIKRPSKAQFERRILFAIVAAPIAIVTSYVLFQRLVLKVEPKRLARREEDGVGVEGDEELRELERTVGLGGVGVLGERLPEDKRGRGR